MDAEALANPLESPQDPPHGGAAPADDEAIQGRPLNPESPESQDVATSSNISREAAVGCGCISPTQDHLENLRTWRQDLNNALRKLPAVDIKYTRVVVLMVYWAASDVSHLKGHAGYLGRVFGEYGYEVETHLLDNKRSAKKDDYDIYNDFRKKLDEVIEKVSVRDQSNLLILYYAGHGATLDGKKPEETSAPYVWQPTQTAPSHRLQFRQCQPMLMNMRADVLFLFDCCYALAMIEEGEFLKWPKRSEILCSSSALEQASALKDSSFTKALAEELEKRSDQRGQGANWYHTLLTSTINTRKHKLVQAPLWRRYSGVSFRTGIFLESGKWTRPQPTDAVSIPDGDSGIGSSSASIVSAPRVIKSTIDELSDLSDARILVKIRLRNPAEQLLTEDWMAMFEQRPENVDSIEVEIVDKVVCHAVFESDSSLLLVTVPIWLWQTIEHNTSYENLGVVRSDNLLAPGRAVGMMQIAKNLSSSKKLGQMSMPPDESKPSVFETAPEKEGDIVKTPQKLGFIAQGEKEEEEAAEIQLKDMEERLLEREEAVRLLEQVLLELEQAQRIKSEKAMELEQRTNAMEVEARRREESLQQKNQELRKREEQLIIQERERATAMREEARKREESLQQRSLELLEREAQLRIKEETFGELDQRANAVAERERRHQESVLLTERRLAERERDMEDRERLTKRKAYRNGVASKTGMQVSNAVTAFQEAFSVINDRASSDVPSWSGWGKWLMNLNNDRFQDLAQRKTQQVSQRQVRNLARGRI